MLKNIDPILTPELLAALMEMGHEDAIVIADANFTAEKYRAYTVSQKIIRLPGLSLLRVARAVLSVLPLGIASEQPVRHMQVAGSAANHLNAAQQSVIHLVGQDAANQAIVSLALERFEFYAQAKAAHAIVQTGELAPYANFIFKKGVLTSNAGF